jgi:two-component sensor histidine kinase
MTTIGVSRFRPVTNEFTDFGLADGYPPTNLSANAVYGTTSYCRTKDGFLVFGTGEGIVLFHPDSIRTNPIPPSVIFTAIKVPGAQLPLRMSPLLGRPAAEYRPIELNDDQNSITFEFAALDYTTPAQNMYAHKLEGLEEDWVPTDHDRNVSYTNLSPGRYVFRVKASNNDGVWNEEGAFVRITILPPWWMTWWFRTLAAVSLIGVIVLVMQLRIRRAVAQERFRLRIASDLHDDIGSSLSSIALVSDNIQRSLDEAHPGQRQLQAVSTVAREVADRLKDDVWVIEPGDDSLESLLLRMKDASKQILGEFPYSFQSEIREARRKLNMEFRKNVLLIHKEALHNVLKHAEATQANISVQVRGDTLSLEIADDGRGFEPDSPRAGHGLVNMRRRAAALKGDLQIDSGPGRGARVKLTARIP